MVETGLKLVGIGYNAWISFALDKRRGEEEKKERGEKQVSKKKRKTSRLSKKIELNPLRIQVAASDE